MDDIRRLAELTVRRWVAFGLLGIATAVGLLAADPGRALRATAILLSVGAALLWRLSHTPERLEGGPSWISIRRGRRPRREMRRAIEESLQGWSRRAAAAAAGAWAFDLAWHMAG